MNILEPTVANVNYQYSQIASLVVPATFLLPEGASSSGGTSTTQSPAYSFATIE